MASLAIKGNRGYRSVELLTIVECKEITYAFAWHGPDNKESMSVSNGSTTVQRKPLTCQLRTATTVSSHMFSCPRVCPVTDLVDGH